MTHGTGNCIGRVLACRRRSPRDFLSLDTEEVIGNIEDTGDGALQPEGFVPAQMTQIDHDPQQAHARATTESERDDGDKADGGLPEGA